MKQEEMMPKLNVNEYVPPSTQAEWQLDPMTSRLNSRSQEMQRNMAQVSETLCRQGDQIMADMRARARM